MSKRYHQRKAEKRVQSEMKDDGEMYRLHRLFAQVERERRQRPCSQDTTQHNGLNPQESP